MRPKPAATAAGRAQGRQHTQWRRSPKIHDGRKPEALVGEFLTTTEIVALARKALTEPAWDFINGGAEDRGGRC
jgi:hypothetical protein